MTGQGHTWSGISLIPAVYYKTFSSFNNHIISLIAVFFLIIGATAPDWLEIRKKDGGTRIKHRTITHWLPLWVGAFCLSLYMMNNQSVTISDITINFNDYLSSVLLGFSMGGLLHLLVDWPNPMGIPVLTPYSRFSLHLWKSGKNEYLIVTTIALFSFFYVGISTDIVTVDLERMVMLITDLFN